MDATTTPTPSAARYLEPGWFTQHLFNRIMTGLTRLGVSVRGARKLAVRGRATGEWRTVPVNPLELDGHRYLVAPRGQTQWVRNLRAAGGHAELHLGRRVEPIATSELDDAAKPAVLREYVRRWKAEVGMFFDGIDETSTDADLLAIAPGFPVFEVVDAA